MFANFFREAESIISGVLIHRERLKLFLQPLVWNLWKITIQPVSREELDVELLLTLFLSVKEGENAWMDGFESSDDLDQSV